MTDDRPLTLNEKVSYGVGQVAESIKNYAFGFFLLFYYNQLLGLSGSLAGLALLIGLMSDAVTDPLVGSISDRWKSKWGRRHPFMYVSIIPLAITFFLVFAPPAGLGQIGLFLWLTIFGIGARVALTLFHVPHASMGAELSQHYTERTSIAQFRLGLGVAGQAAVYILAFLVFFAGEEGQWNAGAYPPYAASLALIMVGTMLWCARGTHHLIPRLSKPGDTDEPGLFGFVKDVVSAFQNHSFRWFFSGVLILFVMVGVDTALALYVGSYIWELESERLFFLIIIGTAGFLVGSFLTRALHRRFDKKPIIMAAIAWWALWQVIPILLYLAGWLPPAGSNSLLITLMVFRFVQMIGTMQALVTSPSMIGDIADEHELESGKRQEGVFYGALTFSSKATTGLGKFVAGIALDLIAWPKGQNILPSDIPPDKIVWLALLYGPIVCGFAVVSVWCCSKYRIDNARHDDIIKQLKSRNSGIIPTPEVAFAKKPTDPKPTPAE